MDTNTKYFIADLVEEVGSLSAVASQIVAMTSDPDCDISKLSQVILSDNVMSARFLALANSASLSRGNEIRSLKDCLVRLGIARVRNVALLMGMHDLSPRSDAAASLDMAEFWTHNLATASCAKNLAALQGEIDPENAWLTGILHGIGLIALSQKVPEDFETALLRARAMKSPLAEAEMTILEFHHGELGGRILNQWHLPRIFSEAVEFHPEQFEEDEVSPEALPLIHLLRDAVQIARAAGFGDNGDGDSPPQLTSLCGKIGISENTLLDIVEKVELEVGEISRLLGMDTPKRPVPAPVDPSQKMAARLALEGLEDTLAREVLEEQLGAAREIQRKLLPDCTPQLPGFELAAANHPCLHISGDYYDFIDIQGGATGLVIADVSGKGMPASLLASNLQASLRALGQVFPDPGELLSHVNRALFATTDPEHFATLFLAVIDPETRSFNYASAGHNPPLLLRADGTINWLKPAGTPLGMFGEMSYPVTQVAMNPGDLLVTYTDGVTEAADDQDREFLEEGLEASVLSRREASCADLLRGVVSDVQRHALADEARERTARSSATIQGSGEYSNGLDDDLTLVVMRRTD